MSQTNRRVTLKDISNACGYSVNTVSRALRNDNRLSQKTIATIQQIADDLGYMRNIMASSLRSGHTNLIAVIIEDIQNPHYSEIISQISIKLRAYDYHLFILCSQFEEDYVENALSLALSYNVSGIFLFPKIDSTRDVDIIKQNHIPLVLIDRETEKNSNDVVRCDDYQGGYLAGQRLASEGHRRFLFLAGPQTNQSQILRYNGFLQAISDAGIDTSQVRMLSHTLVVDAIYYGNLESVLFPVDYTAIVGFNDTRTYSVMNFLLKNGYRVPEDISVISFDYLRQMQPYLLPLTSISASPDKNMADTAVELLLRRMTKPEAPAESVILPVMIYDEGTTGTVPALDAKKAAIP